MGFDDIAATAHELFVSEPLQRQPVRPVWLQCGQPPQLDEPTRVVNRDFCDTIITIAIAGPLWSE